MYVSSGAWCEVVYYCNVCRRYSMGRVADFPFSWSLWSLPNSLTKCAQCQLLVPVLTLSCASLKQVSDCWTRNSAPSTTRGHEAIVLFVQDAKR